MSLFAFFISRTGVRLADRNLFSFKSFSFNSLLKINLFIFLIGRIWRGGSDQDRPHLARWSSASGAVVAWRSSIYADL